MLVRRPSSISSATCAFAGTTGVHEVSGSLLEECDGALRDKYRQYRETDFAQLVVFDMTSLIGWTAIGPQSGATDPLM